jgi:hypothetical protein
MKAVTLPLTFLALLTIASADDLRNQLNASGPAIDKALLKQDIGAFSAAMKTIAAPDFKYYDTPTAQPQTFDQMVANMKAGLSRLSRTVTFESKVLSAKSKDGVGTVLTSHTMVGFSLPDKDKKKHIITFTGVSQDIYKKIGGAWKMESMTWKSTENKVDGHRVKM